VGATASPAYGLGTERSGRCRSAVGAPERWTSWRTRWTRSEPEEAAPGETGDARGEAEEGTIAAEEEEEAVARGAPIRWPDWERAIPEERSRIVATPIAATHRERGTAMAFRRRNVPVY
jgi:hypothetical protein